MAYTLRISEAAQSDLERLLSFLAANDYDSALQTRAAIESAYKLLQEMPFVCRKVEASNPFSSPFFREPLISFGHSGYVALFEIENGKYVTILAFRHQREADYH